jgi:hypothetical protein
VRIDKLKADPTRLRERHRELIQAEKEATGAPAVGPKKSRQLRDLAEEELITQEVPRSKLIECVLDGRLLYVASTAKAYLGTVLLLLRRVEVLAEHKSPWLDHGLPEEMSDIVETRQEYESIHGCRFLKALLGDTDFHFEPEAGRVALALPDERVSLSGAVLGDVHRYVERGAEILAARLTTGELPFTLDGVTFRLSSLRLPSVDGHWTEVLDARLGVLSHLFESLDAKFGALMK